MKILLFKLLKFFGKVIVGILIIIFLLWVMKQIENAMQPRRYIVTGTLEINLNESEKDFTERLKKVLDVEDHVTGVSWNEIQFDRKEGEIVLNVGSKPLHFKYPTRLTVTMHDFRKVNKLSMMLDPFEKKTNHREAKKYIYELISTLNESGWKRKISPSSARIRGDEIIKYNSDSTIYDSIGLDNKYILTDKEWLENSLNWSFYYQDQASFTLYVHREKYGGEDMEQLSGYLFSVFELKTPEHLAYYNFKPHERHRYKELYPALLERAKIHREKAEKKAIEKGYHIDYQYEDSPLNRGIFDLSKEPNQSEQVTPTKSGYWQSFLPEEEKGSQTYVGEIAYYDRGDVFMYTNKDYKSIESKLRWRYLGSTKEYDLVNGKLIKKENKPKEKISLLPNGATCPKNGYWQSYLAGEEEFETVAYYKKGMILTGGEDDIMSILLNWRYLGDENDFKVTDGKLVRRT